MKAHGGIEAELIGNPADQCFEFLNVIGAQHTDDRGRADLAIHRAAQRASSNAQWTLARKSFQANRFGERFHALVGNEGIHFLEYDGRSINRRSTQPTSYSKNPQRWVPARVPYPVISTNWC